MSRRKITETEVEPVPKKSHHRLIGYVALVGLVVCTLIARCSISPEISPTTPVISE